jgi:antitoxin component YwqK of YwqJK toxin-antitoxin module
MENRRHIGKIAAIAFLVALILMMPLSAYAYGNVITHPLINAYAYDKFKNEIMPNDPTLQYAALDDKYILIGPSWERQDGYDKNIAGQLLDATEFGLRGDALRDRKNYSKALKSWIVGAGFSADEPELPMGLRHFYDPVSGTRYLTDWVPDKFANPKMDAVTWAFSKDNKYSYDNGITYFRTGMLMSDEKSASEYYAKAWRSVGEAMHLVSDMTVPAHVRNDGHPFNEPYEAYCNNGQAVKKYKDMPNMAPIIIEDGDTRNINIRILMTDLAFWTNSNFFSYDTTPVLIKDSYGNVVVRSQYPYNELPDGDYRKNQYVYHPAYGVKMAKVSYVTYTDKENGTYKAGMTIDDKVLEDQASLLIPASIRASAAVLDTFLPRFEVSVDDCVPDTDYPGYYLVKGHIDLIPTTEWQTEPSIGNGATVIVDGSRNEVTYENNYYTAFLNDIHTRVKAEPGSLVVLEYNFGGYKVYSPPYIIEIPGPTITPTPTKKPSITATPTIKPTATAMATPKPTSSVDVFKTYVSYHENGVKAVEYVYYISSSGSSVKHGHYNTWNEMGKLTQRCYYQHGKLDGEFEYWGYDYKGNPTSYYKKYFDSGLPEGKWLDYKYENGVQYLSYEQNYAYGKLNGKSIQYNPDGSKFLEWAYVDGKANGPYFEYFSNGNVYKKIDYKDGNMHGEYIEYTSTGKVYYRAVYNNGVRVSYEYPSL